MRCAPRHLMRMIDGSGAASCRFLVWDSDFFGVRVARFVPRRLSPSTAKQALRWCRRQRIDCLYLTAGADDRSTIRLAEDRGFRLTDLRVTFGRELEDIVAPRAPAGVKFRLSRDEDVPALEAVAKTAHRDSRFYADPNFKKSRCDALYRTWIRKSCGGYADAVWVAESRGAPIGYVTCHLREKRRGEIGLVGISEKTRGKGVGRRLVFEALRWLSRQGAKSATVVTQGQNTRAQRLYQRSGFLIQDLELSYHLWPRKQ